MSDWVVIADDLTGACDTGVSFAQRGYTTRVAFDPGAAFSGSEVRVLTTESRALRPDQAVWAMERALPMLAAVQNLRLYKKIDSTLRGHPSVELAALLQGLGLDRVVICPAFPEQRRTVLGGQVFVQGVPLRHTAFAAEVPEPDLLRLFDQIPGCTAVPLEIVRGSRSRLAEILSGPGIFVVDAEYSADLQTLAEVGQEAGIRVYCGAAGLARALVDLLPVGSSKLAPDRQSGPVLLIAGSRAAATLAQVEVLRQQGIPSISLPLETYRTRVDLDVLVLRIASELERQRALILSVVGLPADDSQKISTALARLAAGVLQRVAAGGLVLTGGETAAAVCRALDCLAIELGGEIQPGVVWGRLGEGPYAGLSVVTKAGGFGDRQTLSAALHFLQAAK